MMKGLLLDTNVILYVLQGDEKWQAILERYEPTPIIISIATLMELSIGSRSAKERMDVDTFIQGVQVVPLDIPLAKRACIFLSQRSRSLRSPHFADCIIAATAAELDVPLLTNNPKDFRSFPGVEVL